MAKLTAKQQRFCDEYLIDLNATQAAIRAGYSKKTAYSQGQRMLKNVEVKAHLDEQIERMHNAKTADAKEVMEYLTAVMRGDYTEQVPIFIGEGVQKITDIDVSARDRLKAAELLGKAHMLFTDKVDMGAAVSVVIVDDIENG